jgi:hypothetical protein
MESFERLCGVWCISQLKHKHTHTHMRESIHANAILGVGSDGEKPLTGFRQRRGVEAGGEESGRQEVQKRETVRGWRRRH